MKKEGTNPDNDVAAKKIVTNLKTVVKILENFENIVEA